MNSNLSVLVKQIAINAPLATVWNAWSTAEGLRPIAGSVNIHAVPGGAYEWFLDLPPDERGKRGSEGSYVIAVAPEKLLVFSWTFPPATPVLRAADERTQVTVEFEETAAEQTNITLRAFGWKSGPEWEQGYRYFDTAWEHVLRLVKSTLEKS